MKITLYNEPEVDIDLEEVAWRLSQGDMYACGVMMDLFCDKLRQREKKAGLIDADHFCTFAAVWVEHMPDIYKKKLKEMLNEA